jgi:acyl CoA:acetate/3-ketoacid CoA transferase beta subunit
MCVTDMAVFTWSKTTREMMLTEIAPGLTVDEIKKNTSCSFKVSPTLKEF